MKQLLTFIAILCSYVLCGAQATSLVIDNQTPGWLSSKINYGDQQTVENLTVSGYLNGKDIQFLTDLSSMHNLIGILDLSEASIVQGSDGLNTSENTLLTEWFAKWKPLRKFILPSSLETLTTNEVDYRKAYLFNIDSLIVNCPKLKTLNIIGDHIHYVTVPDGVESIKVYAAKNVKEINFPASVRKLTGYSGAAIGGEYGGTWDGKSELTIHSKISDPKQIEGLKAIRNATIYVPEGTHEEYNRICDKTVTIVEDIFPSEIKFDAFAENLFVGDTYQLHPQIAPSNSIHNDLIWHNSNNTVAKVDDNGLVTAIAYGQTHISATTVNNLSSSVTIYVYEHVSGLSIPQSQILKINETKELSCQIFPLGKTLSEVSWSTSNPEIATVDETGKVTGLSKGICSISATSEDGGHIAICEVSVIQPVEAISISNESISIKVGETSTLTCSVLPANANNKSLTWKSSNTSIATVDGNGKVTALKGGEAIITVASVENPAIKDECIVTVTQPVTGISLNKSALELVEDESEQLIAIFTPENASDKTVNWTSSDVSIAMVSPDGTVYAIKPGQATIMATTVDGGFVALCKVTVKAKTVVAESIALSTTKSDMTVGETLQLTATVLPDNTTDKNLRWTSTNAEIASVNESGLVSALKEGNAQIIASTTDGSNLSAVCEIAVNKRFVPISQIAITPSSVKLAIGETLNVEVQITPVDATNKSISWSTTDASVVTVSPEGQLNANGVGTAMIIASTQDGTNLSVTCNVEVTESKVLITSITIDPSAITGKVGEKYQLNALITPENASEKTIVWSSDNETVATVGEDGFVTLNAKGNALIKATATDGSDISATCAVVVSDYSGINGIEIDPDAYVRVYNIQGALLFEGEYSECYLDAGTYIIFSQGNCIKRIVK